MLQLEMVYFKVYKVVHPPSGCVQYSTCPAHTAAGPWTVALPQNSRTWCVILALHCAHYAHCTLHTVTLHTVTQHTAHTGTLHTAHCTLHTAHCSLRTATPYPRLFSLPPPPLFTAPSAPPCVEGLSPPPAVELLPAGTLHYTTLQFSTV